jgi:hypothetical protein
MDTNEFAEDIATKMSAGEIEHPVQAIVTEPNGDKTEIAVKRNMFGKVVSTVRPKNT